MPPVTIKMEKSYTNITSVWLVRHGISVRGQQLEEITMLPWRETITNEVLHVICRVLLKKQLVGYACHSSYITLSTTIREGNFEWSDPEFGGQWLLKMTKSKAIHEG